MKTILLIGSIFIGMIIPMEDVIANKTTSEASFNYELMCELVETENDELEWSCEFVVLTGGVQVTILGSGAGVDGSTIVLACYEHDANGKPTGETEVVHVL